MTANTTPRRYFELPRLEMHRAAQSTPTRHSANAPFVVNLERRRTLADLATGQRFISPGRRFISTGCPASPPNPSASRAWHGCLRSQPASRSAILPAHRSQTRARSRRCGRLLSECLCTERSAVMLPSFRKSTERLIDMCVSFFADGSVRESSQQTRGAVIEVDPRCTSNWIGRARLADPQSFGQDGRHQMISTNVTAETTIDKL